MSDNEGNGDSGNRYVVRCRGLPWSCTKDELVEFFAPEVEVDPEGIHMTTNREGRASGECYIEVNSKEDQEEAVKKHRKNMGKRYVEVFEAQANEMDWVLKRMDQGGSGGGGFGAGANSDGGEHVVRLRGLPYEATKADITKFFDGLDITVNGILLTTNYQGRATGEAFVQFANENSAQEALKKNKESIGHRYIEVFQSSMSEAFRQQGGGPQGGPPGPWGGPGGPMRAGGRGYGMMGPGGRGGGMGMGRPGPYDRMGGGGGGPGPLMGRGFGAGGPAGRGGRGFGDNGFGGGDFGGRGGWGGGGGGNNGFIVRMRGLPFRVTENEIAEWFSSVADPVGINIQYNNQGRPTGEAEVAFSSAQDAKRSLQKDRQNMQHRYVELFYDGPDPDQGGGGQGGYGGPGGMGSGMGGGMGGGGGGFGGGMGGGGFNNGDGYGGY